MKSSNRWAWNIRAVARTVTALALAVIIVGMSMTPLLARDDKGSHGRAAYHGRGGYHGGYYYGDGGYYAPPPVVYAPPAASPAFPRIDLDIFIPDRADTEYLARYLAELL